MAHDFKTSGFIRAGFQYQDLVAIESLIDFYRDSSRYQWIQVEADGQNFKAIDDVVAHRSDGRFELTQVKFAVDPASANSRLDWDWLTRKKPKGRSMLQKWCATTLAHLDEDSLGFAQLRTDRIPDADFAAALVGTRIDYDRLDTRTRTLVDAQLGGEAPSRRFFAVFDFRHSEAHIDDLEARLWTRVATDTDRGGWALFRAQVERWATRKASPGPDGRIRYVHLQQAFSAERPTPLLQSFRVPTSYSVPNVAFDAAFLARIANGNGVTVLWGPPGRGKSTYLSHCIERLDPRKIVCVRHHYFLSLDDRSEGRFHVQAITRSIAAQLKEMVPGLPNQNFTIGTLIEQAARILAHEGRRLVVVIDGLDHVWRENRDHEHMEELFNGLLPLVDNLHLVVGTQKISLEHLPARLVAAKPPETWSELPLMSITAVRSWIEAQDVAGRLHLVSVPDRERERRAVADAFHSISAGLPLHLIYSFEMVARSGEPVRADDVAALPACPTGDIRDYYRRFLDRASPRAKEILHLLAGLRFGPPPFALGDCLGGNGDADAVAEISHLLEFRETDIIPFHGSLFAFVGDTAGHEAAFRSRAGAVLAWLNSKAPDYWRDAWLWVTEAQLGDDSRLIADPDWHWAVDFLAKGYPVDQLVAILGHAEQAAFARLDLAALQKLRATKIRALNGPEFQTQKWHLFPEIATMLAEDAVPLSLHRTALRQAPVRLLPFLVAASDPNIREALAVEAIDEINERLKRGARADHFDPSYFSDHAHAIAGVVAHLDEYWMKRLLRFAKDNDGTDSILAEYAQASIRAGHFGNVVSLAEQWSGPAFDRELFTALALEGLAPRSKPKARGLGHPATRVLAILKGDTPKKPHRQRDLAEQIDKGPDAGEIWGAAIGPVLYNAYFECLAARLAGKTASPWSQYCPTSKTEHVAQGLAAIETVADFVAETWRTEARWPNLGEFYGTFPLNAPDRRPYEIDRQFVGVRLALADIAVDHIFLGRALDPAFAIAERDIERAASTSFWNDELWVDRFVDRRYRLHTTDAAAAVFRRAAATLGGTRAETNQRTDESIMLAVFAADHGLADTGRSELKRALGCLLGYGWRKDPFASEMLEAVALILDAGDPDARDWLLEVGPAIEQILDYTDGRGTRHARSQLHAMLLDAWPDRAARCLEMLIANENWHYATELLEKVAAHDLGDGALGSALLRTFVAPDERRAMLRAVDKRPDREEVFAHLLKATGLTAAREKARDARITKSDQGTPIPRKRQRPPDFEHYPPGRLADFTEELRKRSFYSSERRLVTEWFDHWVGKGEVLTALADLDKVTAGTSIDLHIENALDVAARTSLEAEGRSKSFEWLIRAQIVRNSWSSFYTGEKEAIARFDFIAAHFKDRWQEFLQRSSRSALAISREGGDLSVGYTRLVLFLLKVGEPERAKACVRAMVDIFLAEVSTLSFDTPDWIR